MTVIPAPLSDWLNREFRTPDHGFLAFTSICEGSKHHSPTPLILHRVSLLPGKEYGPFATLCGTCRDNFRVLQALLVAHEGRLPWEVQRQFGNKIRQLVYLGWRGQEESITNA